MHSKFELSIDAHVWAPRRWDLHVCCGQCWASHAQTQAWPHPRSVCKGGTQQWDWLLGLGVGVSLY